MSDKKSFTSGDIKSLINKIDIKGSSVNPNNKLGKGLSVLLGESKVKNNDKSLENITNSVVKIGINFLIPNKYQPRKTFKEENLEDLANSIKQKGILQPILVREAKEEKDKYEIIAGERRWRAAKKAELLEVPAIIVSFSDKEVLEVGLIENLQRENLNPIEEAEGFKRLIDEFDYTHLELADVVGKSRSYITNYLRVLNLPETIKTLLRSGKLSVGHAKIIVNSEYPMELAEKIVENNLSVREVEKINQVETGKKIVDNKEDVSVALNKDDLLKIEQIKNKFKDSKFSSMKFDLQVNKNKTGTLKIKYKSLEDLYKILN